MYIYNSSLHRSHVHVTLVTFPRTAHQAYFLYHGKRILIRYWLLTGEGNCKDGLKACMVRMNSFICICLFPTTKAFHINRLSWNVMFCNFDSLRLQCLCYFSFCNNQTNLVYMYAWPSDIIYLQFIYIFKSNNFLILCCEIRLWQPAQFFCRTFPHASLPDTCQTCVQVYG